MAKIIISGKVTIEVEDNFDIDAELKKQLNELRDLFKKEEPEPEQPEPEPEEELGSKPEPPIGTFEWLRWFNEEGWKEALKKIIV